MPEDEGLALYEAAREGAAPGPLLEIGSYCGRSTIYLGAAARERGGVVYSIDHHRGSEEHQPEQMYFDPRLTSETGEVDTFPVFRRTIAESGLDDVVVAIVGRSEVVARSWAAPLGLLFIDGSHTEEAAQRDYECWTPFVVEDGLLAIHDVFADPAEGGRAPFHIYRRALDSGAFEEIGERGSLRVLQRVAQDL